MALPTIQPFWVKTYRTPVELSHRRMEKQAALQSCWNNSERFFKHGEIQARKNNTWTSTYSVKRSMDAINKSLSVVLQKDKNISLAKRRKMLMELLTKENKEYQEEMQKVRTSGNKSLDGMQEKVDKLQKEKEEARKKEADKRLYDLWRQNEPRFRKVESERYKSHVIKHWGDQVDEKSMAAKLEEEEKKKYDEMIEEKTKKDIAWEKHKSEERKLQRKQNETELKEQMINLRKREEEAERLRAEEERLLDHEKLLLEAEQKRKSLEEQRKKHELGRVLIRQYKHQLRKKSKEVQQSLENDFKILQGIAEKEKEELYIKSARREKQKADAEYMLKVVADQLRLEKYREADLDALYQEEASRQWQKRESEWERERLAREKLMNAVLEERQEQIKEKMDILHQQQKESTEERERIMQEMENYQQETHREEEVMLTERRKREQEIKEQITSRASERAKNRREEMEEFIQERIENENYEEVLARETNQLNLQEEAPPSYRRRRVAFM